MEVCPLLYRKLQGSYVTMSSSRRRGPAEEVDKEKTNGTTDVRKGQPTLNVM